MRLHDFARKKNQEKITLLTCYDYPSARIIAKSQLDAVLVGDTVAMVVHGHPTTMMADIEMMALHTAAVARGIGTQFLIADMPFLAHRASRQTTMSHVKRLVQAGAQALKIEGGDTETIEVIAYIVASGIPVMGHIGLKPQSVLQLGGYKIQGRAETQSLQILAEAHQLAAAGCFALVLECIPAALAARISKELTIPTIGIGAGAATDGQILVWHDCLGLYSDVQPRFVKQFANSQNHLEIAIDQYIQEVKTQAFPSLAHSFTEQGA